MAKFKLKESLIPKLTERNIISPVTGKIKMRVHYKERAITGVRCVEFDFYPTDVIEVTNPFGVQVMTNKASPRMKVGTEWYVADPSVKWFDVVPDATATTMVLEQCMEVLPRNKRGLVQEYARDKHLQVPNPLEPNVSNEALLQLAKQHKREKLSSASR